ncbi:MAG: universal stress protein [Salinigranum sp.]
MSDRILVPIDDSSQSTEALEYALDLYDGATFVLLHVVDPQAWISSDEFGDVIYSDRLEEAEKEQGEELLAEASEIAADAGADAETVTLVGRPAPSIVEYLEDHDVDAVVMGSHGRRGLDRIFLGSVAEAVTRQSDVPVTIVH